MADKVQAIRAYSPRIIQQKKIENQSLSELIAGRTTFVEGAVSHMLQEFKNALFFYVREGHPLRLEGVGLFSPTIKKDGTLSINFRLDKGLKENLNKKKGGYIGNIVNRDMIGKSVDEMVERWNEEHPDDKIKTKK